MSVEDSSARSDGRSHLSRRGFIRATGAATGAATVGVGADQLGYSPVGDAEAIAPVVVAAGVGTGIAVDWALREYDVIGSEDPPEGLTPDALHQLAYESARTRKSANQSTMIDNLNIIESGLPHTLYSDGKIAAIEAINDGKTESEVQSAALSAAEDHHTTVEKNFLKSWNEGLQEMENLHESGEEHPDLSGDDLVYNRFYNNGSWYTEEIGHDESIVELADGSDFTLINTGSSGSGPFDPVNNQQDSDQECYFIAEGADGDQVEYYDPQDWAEVWDRLETVIGDVRTGLNQWVSGVYDDVQAGDLDPEELLTPRELAEMTADEEDFNQAVADLMALNVSVDLEREAEIYLSHVDATLHGSIARTGEGTLETGTYDPDTEDEDYYLTYDVSMGEGEWDAYESGIDGGIVSFTTEPWEESLFQIETTSGETAEVETTDFEHDDTDDVWTVDISGQLDDSITEIEEVRYYSTIEDTQYETILLDEEFEIVTFTDSDGNEHDSADFTQSEPQSDDNYISEEEWTEMQERHEELIKDYEDAAGGGGFLDDVDDSTIGAIALAALAVLGIMSRD